MLAVGGAQHHVASPRVVVPTPIGFDIHWAQFPVPKRVVDSSRKSSVLLLHPDVEPQLDQYYAGLDDVLFDLRAQIQKPPMLSGAAKSHDVLDAGAVIPTAIEYDDLAGGWEM